MRISHLVCDGCGTYSTGIAFDGEIRPVQAALVSDAMNEGWCFRIPDELMGRRDLQLSACCAFCPKCAATPSLEPDD